MHLISAVSDGISQIWLSWREMGGGVVDNFGGALVGRLADLTSPWPCRAGAIAGGSLTWLAEAADWALDEVWGR
jgi:hypothetical protein